MRLLPPHRTKKHIYFLTEQRRELQGVLVAVHHQEGQRLSPRAHVLQQARPAHVREQEGAGGVSRPLHLF